MDVGPPRADNAGVHLLERDSQLATLREYADEATRGVGRVVLVEGEAGIGKSALLEELESSRPDASWAWGACEGLSTPRPLAPLHDLAEQLGGDLAVLCRAAAPRQQLFDAVVDHLRTREGLCTLVFEDVHWADDATLDLVRHLARRIQRLPVLMLVTFRDDHPAPGLQLALGELVRQRTVRRITLPTLSPEAVRLLVGDLGLDAAQVHKLTGGNPYFVTELATGGRAGLARTARDAVLSRVATLSADARAAIETAALLGARIDADLVSEVADVGVGVLDELVTAGLVVVAERSLRFRHEITRLAVADAVPPFRSSEIHRRALAALPERGSDDASRLAFHAEGAGDAGAVVRHAVQAAEEAASVSSHREAVEHCRRALRFAEDRDGALRRRLAIELGLLDQWEEAEALWREVIASTPAGDPRALGDATRMRSRALWRLSRGGEARAAALAAVEILEPLGPSIELARARGEVAGSAMMQGHGDLAESSARAALALAEELGVADVASDALNVLGCLRVDGGGDWETPLRQALAIARDGDAHSQAGRCYVNLYSSYVDLDRVADGESLFHEGREYVEEHEVPVYGYCLTASRAEALEMTGRWDEALALASELQQTPMSPINRMHLDLTPARIHVGRGLPQAGEAVERLVHTADATEEPQWIAPTLALRAEWHWLSGRQDEARDDIRAAMAAAEGTRVAGRVALWAQRLGVAATPASLGEPFATQLRGDFASAATAWDDRMMPVEAALARLDSGDPQLMLIALETFQRLLAEPLVAMARRRLRESGVRTAGARQSTVSHPAGLTKREQDVLDLLCQGCSNAEIAERLVISVKTAGHHVSAVLAKLDVSTRGEAAETALRRGFSPQDREPLATT